MKVYGIAYYTYTNDFTYHEDFFMSEEEAHKYMVDHYSDPDEEAFIVNFSVYEYAKDVPE